MDNTKICFITCVSKERTYQECVFYIKNLNIPEGIEIEIMAVRNPLSTASAFNKIMNISDAKYKIYLKQNTFIINKNFLYDILSIFNNDKIGMIGVVGSNEIPTDGMLWESNKKFGKVYHNHNRKMNLYEFKRSQEVCSKVKIIDGLIMITQYDIEWREDVFDGSYFYDLSQSLEFIDRGYDVVVSNQDKPWCIYDYDVDKIGSDFDKYRVEFIKKYVKLDLDREDFYTFDKNEAINIMEKNKNIVKSYKNELECELKLKNYENILNIVSKISKFYVYNHAGMYTCETCERALLECAKNLPKVSSIKLFNNQNSKARKVLHVLSEGYSVGGHTRLVKNWIEYDKDSTHSLITTWQANSLPHWLRESVSRSNGEIISLDSISEDYLERAMALRNIANDWADIIILYTHMWDPIPVAAFGIEGKIPVVYVNHYDSSFWLGASIADVVIDISEFNQKVTLSKRGVSKSELLPIPLKEKEVFSKSDERKKHNIDEDATIILTIARNNKYMSVNEINYFKMVKTIIENTENTFVIVIGVDKNDNYWKTLIKVTDNRVICINEAENISDFYKISDIYLESFMLGSHTSKLDAILYGLIPIKFENKVSPNFSNMWSFIDDFDYKNIGQAIDMINRYNNLDREDILISQLKMKNFVLEKHCYDIKSIIEKIYHGVDSHKIKYNLNIEDNIQDYQLFTALYDSKTN